MDKREPDTDELLRGGPWHSAETVLRDGLVLGTEEFLCGWSEAGWR